MKYKAVLRTLIIWGDSKPNVINWIRETPEFVHHAKARKMADAFDKEQPREDIRLKEGREYPLQIVSWEIMSEKQYAEIKGN